MQKLLIILISAGLALSASAQKIGGGFRGGFSHGGSVGYIRPRVTVLAGPAYPYLGYGYRFGLGYSPFYSPYGNYGYRRVQQRPTQLDLNIQDIKNDYSYQISEVRKDKSVPRKERRQKIRALKHEKDDAIIDAQINYYSQKDYERKNQPQS